MHSCTVFHDAIWTCGTYTKSDASKRCWSFTKETGILSENATNYNHYSAAMVTITYAESELGVLIATGSAPRHGVAEFKSQNSNWNEVATLPTVLSSLSMNYSERDKKAFVFGGFTGKTFSSDNGK